MDQAWLDSLSEDWVSQPRSGSPVQSLPSLSNSTSDTSQARVASSRIPKYSPQKQSWTAADNANSPLSERSLNENNVPLSQHSLRHPSKLREVTTGTRGRRLSRTLSASTTHSVQYHTIQHKSVSLSPQKGRCLRRTTRPLQSGWPGEYFPPTPSTITHKSSPSRLK
jgi:hypothetical protein